MGKYKMKGHTLPGPNQKASIGKNLDIPSASVLDELEAKGTYLARPNKESTNAPELDSEGNVKMYLNTMGDFAGTRTVDSEGNLYINKPDVDRNIEYEKQPDIMTTDNLQRHSKKMRSKYGEDGKRLKEGGSGAQKKMKYGRNKQAVAFKMKNTALAKIAKQAGGNGISPSSPDLRDRINTSLGDINYKARTFSEDEEGSIDNIRHTSAGRYTAEAIQDKVKNIPYAGKILDFLGADKIAGLMGSNALGLGHELKTIVKDD